MNLFMPARRAPDDPMAPPTPPPFPGRRLALLGASAIVFSQLACGPRDEREPSIARGELALVPFIPSPSLGIVQLNYQATNKQIRPDQMMSTILPNGYVPAARYPLLRPGLEQLRQRYFRFPNGSPSDTYHWNGDPTLYDADHVWNQAAWNASGKLWNPTVSPGVFVDIKHRGTTLIDQWGNAKPSHLTDGNPETMWLIDPSIAEPARMTFVLTGASFRRVVIRWASSVPPTSLTFAVKTTSDWCYPPPAGSPACRPLPPNALPEASWSTPGFAVAPGIALFGPGPHGTSTLNLSQASSATQLRIEISRPAGAAPLPGIGEVEVFHEAGTRVSVNDVNAKIQTRAYAAPTYPAGVPPVTPHPFDRSWDFETFMSYLRAMPNDAQPVICVNYGTGTPAEAAAWVDYANRVRRYGIKHWQVGNEMEGYWEEGGPVSARIYAERFVAFSRAMKLVDPSILVLGPVYSGRLTDLDSQDHAGGPTRNFMHEFLARVAAYEAQYGQRLLDGIDLHKYPHWIETPNLGDVDAMLGTQTTFPQELRALHGWIDGLLTDPGTRTVHLSEYNTSTGVPFVGHSMLANTVGTLNLAATFASEFGQQAFAYLFQPSSGDPKSTTPDPNNYGDPGLLSYPLAGVTSSLNLPPTSTYWGQFMLGRVWLDFDRVNQVVEVTSSAPQAVRAFAVLTPDHLRVLLLNMTANVQQVQAGSFPPAWGGAGPVVVYTESEREFSWQGTDIYARARPNGGPSSSPVANLTSPISLQPHSTTVIVIPRTPSAGASAGPPDIVHLGAERRPGTEGLNVFGSVLAPERISRLEFAWDGINFSSLTPLDGSKDGPAEAFSIAADAGTAACLKPTVRATNSSGVRSRQIRVDNPNAMQASLLVDDFNDQDNGNALGGWWFAWTCTGTARFDNRPFGGTLGGRLLFGANTNEDCGATLSAEMTVPAGAEIRGLRFRAFLGVPALVPIASRLRVRVRTTDFRPEQIGVPSQYNLYEVTLPSVPMNWHTYSMALSDFIQPEWDTMYGPLDGRKIDRIDIQVLGEEYGWLYIDDVEFLKCPASAP